MSFNILIPYNHLHGFFQGEHTDMSPESLDRIEFANAVLITDDSHVVGQDISSLNLKGRRVVVVALKRDGVEIEQPADSTILQAQDTLIIRGKPRRVERVERYLQKGH